MTYVDGKLDAAAESDPQAKTRKGDRDSLFMQGVLHIEGQQPVTVRVRNLAAGGMMADYAGALGEGDTVQVELRNVGMVAGKIAWKSPSQFGMSFDSEIDPHAMRRPINSRSNTPRPVTLAKYDKGGRGPL